MSTPAPDPALKFPEDAASFRLAKEAIRRRIGLADSLLAREDGGSVREG